MANISLLLKITSLAAFVIFSAVTAWLYVPKAIVFISSAVPPFWTALHSWLNHLSIFLAINFIVFLIFRFSQTIDHRYQHGGVIDVAGDKPKVEYDGVYPPLSIPAENSSDVVVCKKAKVDFDSVSPPISDVADNISDEVVFKQPKAEPPPGDGGAASDASCVTMETEGGADEAQSSKENNDSMDATWQAIMASKDAPARRLKKSDTWERRLERTAPDATVPAAPVPAPEKKKEKKNSQTSRDGRSIPEAVDEMDKKFDAFIQKNYDQMRRRQQIH